MEVLAKRVKWLREKKRMGQKEVAAEIGMTVSGIQKIEYGERDPKLEKLIEIAKLFNVTTDFLLGLSNEIGDLQELKGDLHRLLSHKEVMEEQITHLRGKSHELQDTIVELEQSVKILKHRDQATDSLMERKLAIENHMKELNNIFKQKDKKEKEIFEIQKSLGKHFINYLSTVLSVPFFNIENDMVMAKFKPLNFSIQLNIFDEFSVSVFTKEGYMGHIDDYKSEEEAQRKIEELEIKLKQ
jgi:transcriptional regulator with XRE-family HTH domain